ncbi:myoD family inhibitor domain-containing protein isoform X1 [Corvus cornix cornix]|uniref:myoD family inhibitor domain-containing protein isoform X1 n=1 Tax=Corvus cornix cornix TaxID=932674 RepID=UPI000534C588|nr:myoD family inhibitor domain-containing protein isoform X1 [Corvus cornix cornix]XP_041874001.1 myoD family inhibitor domain-containing protein isoform X1 [Corvus kubaryi]
MSWARTAHETDDHIRLCHGKEMYFLYGESPGSRVSFVGGGCRHSVTRGESWQMSQVREPLPPGPGGPEQAPTENSSLISLPRGKTDQETTVTGDKDINQPCSNQSIQAEIQEQSIWGNRTDGDLIRTQPQRLPQPNTSALERSEEESGKIQNGHVGLSKGSGIHNGVKHMPADNRKLSAPVSEKMHRKIQSTLSVNSNSSKKSKISSAFSQKPGTSPEDCCVHCILACLFCEFLTLCNIVLGQASCGICTSEACCCCCGDEMGDDCNCPCDMDCGIMDACCESSDCLEICMECCGICFPS